MDGFTIYAQRGFTEPSILITYDTKGDIGNDKHS